MSLDFEIWSVKPLVDVQSLPRADDWVAAGTGWAYAKNRWQITIDGSVDVDEVDLPPEIGTGIVGVSFLTRVTLEPIHAPKIALSLLRQVVRAVARSRRGTAFDLQDGALIAASGRSRPLSVAKGETIELLKLTWWFLDGPLTTKEGARDLIGYFQAHLPQFVPRRYGGYEPPECRFDPKKPDHFFDFVLTEPLIVVWRPHGKLFDVSYNVAHKPGWRWRPGLGDRHFCAPHLELSCPAKLIGRTWVGNGPQAVLEGCFEAGAAILW